MRDLFSELSPAASGPEVQQFLVGTVSGLMNGMLAMGGMWAMTLLVSSGVRVATLPALVAGVWLGSLKFEGSDAKTFRSVVLMVLALLLLVKALHKAVTT